MTIEEAIKARHSVRNYKHQPLAEELIGVLQQKIDECNTLGKKEGKMKVKASTKFSMMGYTKMDLGIAKYHFEIGAGKENFEWA